MESWNEAGHRSSWSRETWQRWWDKMLRLGQWITWGPHMLGRDPWVSFGPRIYRKDVSCEHDPRAYMANWAQSMDKVYRGDCSPEVRQPPWDHAGWGVCTGTQEVAIDHQNCYLTESASDVHPLYGAICPQIWEHENKTIPRMGIYHPSPTLPSILTSSTWWPKYSMLSIEGNVSENSEAVEQLLLRK